MPRAPIAALLLLACVALSSAPLPAPASAAARSAAEPTLALTPNQAPCGTTIIARGSGFPAGDIVEITVFGGGEKPTADPPPIATVAADGTFALALVPCTASGAAVEGTQYTVATITPNNDPFVSPAALAHAIFTVGPVAQRPIPSLALSHDSGACNGPAIASGAGWFPGDTLALTTFQLGTHQGIGFAEVTVAADGTFSLPFELHRATLCDARQGPPLGTKYRIGVGPYRKRNSPRLDSASVTYTITQARLTERCFVETGHCVRGTLYDRWERHGLAGNGYPLGDEFDQVLEDGNTYRVQYFERVRLERHPEHAPPYDILLGQFGRRIVATVPSAPTAPAAPLAGDDYFAETGHNVDARFMAYWLSNGGLAQFAFPLTEPFEQRLEDGKLYLVQYFERARFEHHPEHAGTPYEVLLGQFGRTILIADAPSVLTLDPASGPCATAVTVRGSGFTPGAATRFILTRDSDGAIIAANTSAGGRPVTADGTYTTFLPRFGCDPDAPVGATFTFTVNEYYPGQTPQRGPGASATFTVRAPSSPAERLSKSPAPA